MVRRLNVRRAPRPPVVPEAARTSLAWTRTALALVLHAAVAARAGLLEARGELLVLGAILAVAAGVAGGLGAWRRRRLSAARRAPPGPPPWLMAGMLAVCWLACASALRVVMREG